METKMKKDLIGNETVLDQLKWRYAVKKFDPQKKISEADWATLEEAMILAPSSYGLQPYKFIVITDPAMKEKLGPACYGQPQITDSSHLVVLAARKQLPDDVVDEYIDRLVELRGTPRETLEGYIAMMKGSLQKLRENGLEKSWSQRQVYIALGFLLETAAILGVDACPMEGFEPTAVDELIGLTDYTASALCTFGYRAEDDRLAGAEKVRFSKKRLIARI